MKSVRERFEEIWPVPFGVYWSDDAGEYMPLDGADHWQYSQFQKVRDSYCARLDTFTRCQETTNVYVSLIQEMVDELSQQPYPGDWYYRAKQIMEQKK